MKRKSAYEPALYFLALIVSLLIVMSLDITGVEYQNFNGSRGFHFDASHERYSEMIHVRNRGVWSTERCGVYIYSEKYPGFSFFNLQIASWFFAPPVAVVGAVLATFATARRLRMSSRADDGLCVKCGYDLTATPNRCPECGAVASKE
jgi:hypothetical protein